MHEIGRASGFELPTMQSQPTFKSEQREGGCFVEGVTGGAQGASFVGGGTRRETATTSIA